jgi:hypothetical protein
LPKRDKSRKKKNKIPAKKGRPKGSTTKNKKQQVSAAATSDNLKKQNVSIDANAPIPAPNISPEPPYNSSV